MIVTGIAHNPQRLHERNHLPSGELVYLAKVALKTYHTERLITSLSLGWEMALAKAAIELEIPYTVAIPFPGRDADWHREARLLYLDLLSRGEDVYRVSDSYSDTAFFAAHCWRVERADLLLSLWDYEFSGITFEVMDYALCQQKQVVNLWQDWSHLYTLRRKKSAVSAASARRGAQVF